MTATLPEARRLRDAGFAATESRPGADQDRKVIDQAIKHFTDRGDVFSSNDVRRVLPVVAPQLIGSRFNAASRRGQIVRVGSELADHESGHARRVSTWCRPGGSTLPAGSTLPPGSSLPAAEPQPPVLTPVGEATMRRAEYALSGGSTGLRNTTEARALIRQLLDVLTEVTGIDTSPGSLF